MINLHMHIVVFVYRHKHVHTHAQNQAKNGETPRSIAIRMRIDPATLVQVCSPYTDIRMCVLPSQLHIRTLRMNMHLHSSTSGPSQHCVRARSCRQTLGLLSLTTQTCRCSLTLNKRAQTLTRIHRTLGRFFFGITQTCR